MVSPRRNCKKQKPPFNVRRYNRPIAQVLLPDGVDPGITYNTSFAEWEAVHAAGLDLQIWDDPDGSYTPYFKAKVLAWHKAHTLVKAHTQAAMNKRLASKGKSGAK